MKKPAWTLVAVCAAAVVVAAVVVCCRGGRPSGFGGIPAGLEPGVTEPATEKGFSEPEFGEDPPNLVIVRETPLEAETNQSDRIAMLGPLDDKTALKIASRSLQGTPGSHGRTPAINRTGTETIVRWPVLSAYAQTSFQPGSESLSVWIDDKTWSIIQSRDAVLSVEDAFRIARAALIDWNYDRTAPVEADCRSSHVLFTFPNHPTDGMRIGFYAKVAVSLETGTILGIEQEAD